MEHNQMPQPAQTLYAANGAGTSLGKWHMRPKAEIDAELLQRLFTPAEMRHTGRETHS
jgi:hypothetical protein